MLTMQSNQHANTIHLNRIYRHFKGNLYYVKDVAQCSETNVKYVVYQALYGDFNTYIRPMDMFLSLVDKKKYPDANQQYRFELIE